VNGVLNDMALGSDDGVAGIRGMAEGQVRWFVGRIGLSRRRRREEATRKSPLNISVALELSEGPARWKRKMESLDQCPLRFAGVSDIKLLAKPPTVEAT